MRVCEAWYSVRLNVLGEPNNSKPSRNEDLINDFIKSMHAGMLCFHLNVFKYAVVFLLERISFSYKNAV